MKKLLFLLVLNCSLVFSQTLEEFKLITLNYGKTFHQFEENIQSAPISSDTKFGIEDRLYEYDTFSIIATEKYDDDKISKIVFLSKKETNNRENWYIICKYLDSENYEFIESQIVSYDSKIKKNNLKFSEMINVLRGMDNTNELAYWITFKKDNLYYRICQLDEEGLYLIEDKYEKEISTGTKRK